MLITGTFHRGHFRSCFIVIWICTCYASHLSNYLLGIGCQYAYLHQEDAHHIQLIQGLLRNTVFGHSYMRLCYPSPDNPQCVQGGSALRSLYEILLCGASTSAALAQAKQPMLAQAIATFTACAHAHGRVCGEDALGLPIASLSLPL